MKFALVFIGVLHGLFAVGRLMWPDPDGSLDQKNQAALDDFCLLASQLSALGFVFMFIYPIVIVSFFSFHRPTAGLAIAAAMIAIGFAI